MNQAKDFGDCCVYVRVVRVSGKVRKKEDSPGNSQKIEHGPRGSKGGRTPAA